MSKRSGEIMDENVVNFNNGAGGDQTVLLEDVAFILEADTQILRVATLCNLLRVVDLTAVQGDEDEFHMNISCSLREFGALLSKEAHDASSKLMFGKLTLHNKFGRNKQ